VVTMGLHIARSLSLFPFHLSQTLPGSGSSPSLVPVPPRIGKNADQVTGWHSRDRAVTTVQLAVVKVNLQ
jgi:hypothetical protein